MRRTTALLSAACLAALLAGCSSSPAPAGAQSSTSAATAPAPPSTASEAAPSPSPASSVDWTGWRKGEKHYKAAQALSAAMMRENWAITANDVDTANLLEDHTVVALDAVQGLHLPDKTADAKWQRMLSMLGERDANHVGETHPLGKWLAAHTPLDLFFTDSWEAMSKAGARSHLVSYKLTHEYGMNTVRFTMKNKSPFPQAYRVGFYLYDGDGVRFDEAETDVDVLGPGESARGSAGGSEQSRAVKVRVAWIRVLDPAAPHG